MDKPEHTATVKSGQKVAPSKLWLYDKEKGLPDTSNVVLENNAYFILGNGTEKYFLNKLCMQLVGSLVFVRSIRSYEYKNYLDLTDAMVTVCIKQRADLPAEVKGGVELKKEAVHCINLKINGEVETVIFDSEAVYRVWLDHIRRFCMFENYRDFYEASTESLLTPYCLELKFRKKNTTETYRWARIYEKKQLNRFPEMMALVKNELNVLRKIDHPNLTRGFEGFESAENIRMIIDSCSKETLRKRVLSAAQGRLDYRESLEILYRLVQGLVYFHDTGRVHLNLHPESVRFKDNDRSFDVCLADFGFSRPETDLAKGGVKFSGAYGFAAPELMAGGPCGKPADVFSLGVTLYSCITGTLPFTSPDPDGLVREMKAETADLGVLRDLGIPVPVSDLIASMLRYSPKDRPSSKAVMDHPAFDLLDQLSVLVPASPVLKGLPLATAYAKTLPLQPEFYRQYVSQLKATYSKVESV